MAISDIHGALDMFEVLLEKVSYDPAQDQLILLGDYVDRGPNACGVINKVMSLKEEGAIVLRGNHDDMLVTTVEEEPGAWERWSRNGAKETLLSYEPDMDQLHLPDSELFKKHVAFLKQLDYYYETDTHIFVHAGVVPGLPLEETDPFDLVWIRESFFQKYKGDKIVVFGHTPTPILHQKQNRYDVFVGENNIVGIDGGAVYGGQLNCLELPGNKTYSVRNDGR
nr:metallophosphoesterase family protein [Lentibacillus sp. JNUCC-1]